jgi:voltage-gated potassium channel
VRTTWFPSTRPCRGVRLVGALVSLAALGVITWLIAREVRGPEEEVRVEALVLAVVVGTAVFALTDLVVARAGSGQFVGLETKTDALYFALTTLTTVGFGDVHATGQLARGLMIIQLLFNVIVLAAAAADTVIQASRRRR